MQFRSEWGLLVWWNFVTYAAVNMKIPCRQFSVVPFSMHANSVFDSLLASEACPLIGLAGRGLSRDQFVSTRACCRVPTR